jgi:hypothetical protein
MGREKKIPTSYEKFPFRHPLGNNNTRASHNGPIHIPTKPGHAASRDTSRALVLKYAYHHCFITSTSAMSKELNSRNAYLGEIESQLHSIVSTIYQYQVTNIILTYSSNLLALTTTC